MIKREESRHDFAFMTGVVIGAIAGAVATLALAPRAGSDTRERWRARVNEMPIDDLRARATTLRDAAASGTTRLREKANEAASSELVGTTKARVTEMVDKSPLPVTLGTGDDMVGETQESLAEEVSRTTGEEDGEDSVLSTEAVSDSDEKQRT